MAPFSKIVELADLRELTITCSSEPFPDAANCGHLKVIDDRRVPWDFEYRVKNRNRRVLSGKDWGKFITTNKVQAGHKVTIERLSQTEYKIEVSRT
ncbi:hypothetical protein CXB51_007422 [Gossypium anomalum]|nr:hypothetical protein ES319_A03G231100v1 [Gossypium barbadense]KAG4209650.1 hypothetical protein ERO13_A03G214600v2 [Gossypium hirsutum]KAG8497731.1 hypothetical protein CXB51_007422 [Gossypium anomalum]TYJ44579.1 hypothetical protein E1A91_A03G235700v1 [Gossypium mustelinum]